MIKSFRSKDLAELWRTDKARRIDVRFHRRLLARLDSIDIASKLAELDLPGYDFHALRGFKPTRFTIHVNGPWCLTFEFDGTDAYEVDFEQYH